MPDEIFAAGSEIEIHGLRSHKDFNGELAKVLFFSPRTGRYTVQLKKDNSEQTVSQDHLRLVGPITNKKDNTEQMVPCDDGKFLFEKQALTDDVNVLGLDG